LTLPHGLAQNLPNLAQPKESSLSACLRQALSLVVILLFIAPLLHAQFSASVSGTVTDTNGAVIPSATVTLTETATHAVKTTTTSSTGFYHFSELAPGNYGIVVAAPGFKTTTLDSLDVAAESPRTANVKLSVGQAAEQVTVNGSEEGELQTADASVGATISSADVTRLPIFGRDPYELLRVTPGTTADGARNGTGAAVALPNSSGPGQSNFGIFQTENQIQISAAGQRLTSNSFLIDGVSVDSLLHGGSAVITPNPESVGQITMTSTSFDASDGRNVGMQIRTVTKSGTNDLHGSLFFQYDEPGLNAFQAYGGPSAALPERVENKQREWAASLGGPIRKDKLFWFASYEGVSSRNNTFSEQYIPTPQYVASLSSSRQGGIVAGVLTGKGGQASVVKVLPTLCQNVQPNPSSSVNPDSGPNCVSYAGGVDVGSLAGGVGTYPANASIGGGLDGVPDIEYAQVDTPAHFHGNQFNGRADWNRSPHDQFAASVYFSKLDQLSGDASTGAQPISNIPFKPFNSSGTLVYIHTFGSGLLNEARGNYTRFADNQIQDSSGIVNWGVPRFEVQNYTFGRLYSGAVDSPDSPAIFAENTYEVRDTLIRTVGTHTFRVGGQFRWEQDNDDLSGEARPDYVFGGMWNWANDAPIFEQVAANPNTGGTGNAKRYYRDHDFSGFVQDDWRAMPGLTLNLGLRYEFFSPLANKGFLTNQPVFGSSYNTYLTGAQLTLRNHLWSANRANWGPKFGFAWAPPAMQSKLVVRGGFGISYDRLDDVMYINGYENGPNYFVYDLCCASSPATEQSNNIVFALGSSDSPFSYPQNAGLAKGVNPTTGLPNSASSIEIYAASLHTPQPMLYSYSLGVQRELPWDLVASVGYQGSTGHHFLRLVNQNFLYPTCYPYTLTGCAAGAANTPFYATYIPTTDGYSNYNGLNATLSKRFSHGYNISIAYTYSKSLDQLSNEGPGAQSNQTDPADPQTEYGPSDFDVRHRFVASGNWDLPKFHGGRGLFGEALSGWQINGIFTYHTGFPWTPVTGVPSVAHVTSAATIAPTRPLAYFGGAGNSCSNSAYINGSNFSNGGKSYFAIGSSGPPGIGRNSWNGPCYLDTDMSFAKELTFGFRGHESLFRFQANAYNLFNKTDLEPITFGSPEATIENTLFGLSPTADSGRVIEFLARFQF
jgi:hypothetical protein